jgi:hypothetical protein
LWLLGRTFEAECPCCVVQELGEKKQALQQTDERIAQMEDVLRREPLKREAGMAGRQFFF